MFDPAHPVILNVDDNDGARYAKTRTLQRAGFLVLEASSGSEALSRLKSDEPDLVLLDVKLPDINGFEVCRRIKGDPSTESILVLQTSASFIGIADKVRALDGGADSYLVEPIEPEELIANVKALLRLRRVEAALRESEGRFRQMAENIDDVFWIFSPRDGSLLYVSPAYELLWGRSIERLREHFEDWIEGIHADDRERVRGAFARLQGRQQYDEEYRVVQPGGEVRWIRDRGFPVRDEGGEFYRVARISQDISERKAAEQTLQESDRRKDEFLATLAHELRNPLGPIRNAVELLRRAGPDRPDVQEKARQMIGRQTDHLVRLVDDLLDVSRITQGKVTLKQEAVNVTSFVASALETVKPFIDSRHHHLTVTLPDHDVWVRGDAVRLCQIVGNLLHNAGKYTPEGGEISLTAEQDGDWLKIAVADNGIGISPNGITRIFDLFAQAEHAPDRAQDGLGIGLSLVKSLVELHGGQVRVSSAGVGAGSSFEVALPVLADAIQTQSVPPPAGSPENKRGRRILVVDDSADSVEMLTMLLQANGHEIRNAQDGASALEIAEQYRPEMVFLDIGLPGMNGYEVARSLRRLPSMAHAKLIALTGYGQEKDRQRALEAGFDHHIVKPVDFDRLSRLIA